MAIPAFFEHWLYIPQNIIQKHIHAVHAESGLSRLITHGVMLLTGPTYHVLCRTSTDGNALGIVSQQPEANTLGPAQNWWLQLCREQKFLFDLLSFILLLCFTFGICCTYLGLGGSVRCTTNPGCKIPEAGVGLCKV